MSCCSRFCWCGFAVLDFKSSASSCIYSHFQQHFYCARTETAICELPVKFFYTIIRLPDSDFLIECEILASWRQFHLIFAIYVLKVSYLYVRFIWPTDLESILHALTLTVIISSKFEIDMIIHYRVIAFLLQIHYLTLWPNRWLFDLEQLLYMADHVVNPFIKFEDPMPIRSWLISHNVFHWIPLTSHFWLLCMRHIMWPVRKE